MDTVCLLCSHVHICFLKIHPLPSWCDKDLIGTHDDRAGSSHLLFQGGAGWQLLLAGKERGDQLLCGQERVWTSTRGAAARGPPWAPEEIQLWGFLPFLQLSPMRKGQKKDQTKPHQPTERVMEEGSLESNCFEPPSCTKKDLL